ALNGTFTFLRGTAAGGGISASPTVELGPWLGLGLAAALAVGVTVVLSALIRRQLHLPVPPAAAEGGA
ncbi:MAG: hypothetical protein ACXWW6_05430, partial [Candidatus Limnocylindrales bacterium]